MKVKLLKKIRKRFSIVRVDKPDIADEDNIHYHIYKEYGVPHYLIEDEHSELVMNYCKTFKEALTIVVNMTIKIYGSKFKYKGKSTKVWYNK